MPIGIDPKVDFAFKVVYGNPHHPRVTIHFLNSVLDLPNPIESVEILNPILDRQWSEDKLAVLDILAEDCTGRRLNIEMQTSLPLDLPKRLTYYNCLTYVRQIPSGTRYLDLQPVIGICVLNRTLFAQADEYHLSFRLRSDQRSDLVFTDQLQFHLLELPKFAPVGDNVSKLPRLERWLYFLQRAPHMEPEELAALLVEPEYLEAIEILQMISRSPEDRDLYEARMKFLNDQEAKLIAADQAGEARGVEKGVLCGKIQLMQQLLGEPVDTTDDLAAFGRQHLEEMLVKLQQRLRSRNA